MSYSSSPPYSGSALPTTDLFDLPTVSANAAQITFVGSQTIAGQIVPVQIPLAVLVQAIQAALQGTPVNAVIGPDGRTIPLPDGSTLTY
jgi:hypothetical protein